MTNPSLSFLDLEKREERLLHIEIEKKRKKDRKVEMVTDMREVLEGLHFTHTYWIIVLPVLLMGLDILTGLIYAWTSKTFQSARMRAGLAKKFGEIAYIVSGVAVTYAMGLPLYILIGIAVYICFMELMSILENCDKLGAPVPGFVKAVLNNIDDSLKHDSIEELDKKAKDAANHIHAH